MLRMQNQQEKHTKKLVKCKVLGPCASRFEASYTGSWRLDRPVVRYSDCIGCGTCSKYCPTGVIDIEKEAEQCVIINYDYCKGCGVCANECPKQCIDMVDERSVE